jgi:uncharacterized protein YaaW (UPF0174 family)
VKKENAMIYTMSDIEKLLTAASQEERDELAALLGLTLETSSPQKTASTLVKQFMWKYQTPLGYLVRTPTFDEICVDVAKRLKLGDMAREDISCWQLLEWVIENLIKKLIDEMTPKEKEDFLQSFLTDAQRKVFGKRGVDWTAVASGSFFLALKQFGGFATYRVSLVVANQAARVLVGRGLTLAANAALVRGLSIALGPVGWVLLVWGINDLLGTNYKRVIPATLYLYCIHSRLEEEASALPLAERL